MRFKFYSGNTLAIILFLLSPFWARWMDPSGGAAYSWITGKIIAIAQDFNSQLEDQTYGLAAESDLPGDYVFSLNAAIILAAVLICIDRLIFVFKRLILNKEPVVRAPPKKAAVIGIFVVLAVVMLYSASKAVVTISEIAVANNLHRYSERLQEIDAPALSVEARLTVRSKLAQSHSKASYEENINELVTVAQRNSFQIPDRKGHCCIDPNVSIKSKN